MLNFQNNKKLNLDWQTNDAVADGVEFIISPHKTTTSMSLLESSGSGIETAWDLEYVPSASNSAVGNIRLRINNHSTISNFIGTNAESASTDYFDIGNGKIFNVYVTAENTSASSNYFVSVTHKDEDKIDLFTTASLTTSDTNVITNWKNTGSLTSAQSGNLVVGENYVGYLSDVKLWKSMISWSKIKQHTLNPESIVGNSVNSYESEIVYHLKLSENHPSGSTSKTIVDSNPNYIKDYSREIDFDIIDSTYVRELVDCYKFIPRTDGFSQKTSKMITADLPNRMVRNLNPRERSFKSSFDIRENKRVNNSTTVDYSKSPADTYNRELINRSPDKDITQYYAKWSDLYEQNYADLDALRKEIFKNIKIDINEYIAAQAKIFNPYLLQTLQAVLPGRVKLINGVTLEQNMLERSKFKYQKSDIENIPIYTGDISEIFDFSDSSFIDEYGKDDFIDFISLIGINNTSYVSPYTNVSLDMVDDIRDLSFNYVTSYLSNILDLPDEIINYSITYDSPYLSNTLDMIDEVLNYSIVYDNPYLSNTIDLPDEIINYSMTYDNPYLSNTIDLPDEVLSYSFTYHNSYLSNILDMVDEVLNYSITYDSPYLSNTLDMVDDIFDLTSSYSQPYTTNLQDWPWLSYNMEWNPPHSASVNYIQNKNLDEIVSPLKYWGRSVNDTWIMNMAYSGSNQDYNTGYYDDRIVHYVIGDMEYQSASRYVVTCSDFVGTNCSTDRECDASDYTCLHNRLMLDQGKGYTYNSYFGSSSINPKDGAQLDGRPMGKTTFINTDLDGNILYPSNHYRHFHTTKDQLRNLYYGKTPEFVESINNDGDVVTGSRQGIGQFGHIMDLFPEEEFYTINVDGSDSETVLRVESPDDRPGIRVDKNSGNTGDTSMKR